MMNEKDLREHEDNIKLVSGNIHDSAQLNNIEQHVKEK